MLAPLAPFLLGGPRLLGCSASLEAKEPLSLPPLPPPNCRCFLGSASSLLLHILSVPYMSLQAFLPGPASSHPLHPTRDSPRIPGPTTHPGSQTETREAALFMSPFSHDNRPDPAQWIASSLMSPTSHSHLCPLLFVFLSFFLYIFFWGVVIYLVI